MNPTIQAEREKAYAVLSELIARKVPVFSDSLLIELYRLFVYEGGTIRDYPAWKRTVHRTIIRPVLSRLLDEGAVSAGGLFRMERSSPFLYSAGPLPIHTPSADTEHRQREWPKKPLYDSVAVYQSKDERWTMPEVEYISRHRKNWTMREINDLFTLRTLTMYGFGQVFVRLVRECFAKHETWECTFIAEDKKGGPPGHPHAWFGDEYIMMFPSEDTLGSERLELEPFERAKACRIYMLFSARRNEALASNQP